MTLEYLKQIGFIIPSGYTVATGAMTADSRRVYFAASHPTQPTMLIYDMEGVRQEASEFNIHALSVDRSFDAVANDVDNLFLISNSPSVGVLADVYPYSKTGTAGRGFALEGIPDDFESPFEEVRGAVFLNEEIVVLLCCTVTAPRLSIARFKPDGAYVPQSFTRLGIPSDTDPRGMSLAGTRVFVLGNTHLLALDRGFAYVPSENIGLRNPNPVSVGWNGSALLVYDRDLVDFYGGEQPVMPKTPSKPKRQYRSRAFKKYEETLDVVKRNADGLLTTRGIAVKGLHYSSLEEVYLSDSPDLTRLVQIETIILRYPIPEIEVDDFIFKNTGATPDNPSTEIPGETLQVKGFDQWGNQYKQVLYCVQNRGEGIEGPIRIRRKR